MDARIARVTLGLSLLLAATAAAEQGDLVLPTAAKDAKHAVTYLLELEAQDIPAVREAFEKLRSAEGRIIGELTNKGTRGMPALVLIERADHLKKLLPELSYGKRN